jgi:prepilin-type N-terminal cleavage/methylation domain-containing protein
VHVQVIHKNIQKKQGFTIVEIMVALVILAVGLLGMAGMTVVVMRGSRGAEDLANATNVCQQKIEELKDTSWTTLGSAAPGDPTELTTGLTNEAMLQEVDLNSQGMSWNQFCKQQISVTSSPCDGQSTTDCDVVPEGTGVTVGCKQFLDQAGPYKYTRSFVICKGDDYTDDAGTPKPPDHSKAYGGNSPPANLPNSAEPNCSFSTSDDLTRPATLGCESNDILTIGNGAADSSPERMIKILCTWRAKDGRCSYVNFEALRMNNL